MENQVVGFTTKKWTVNVQVDVKYLLEHFDGNNNCSNPVGGNRYWHDHVRMAAVSDDASDFRVFVGNGDTNNLKMEVKKGEAIQWLVTPMDPLYGRSSSEFRYSLAISGFDTGSNWDDYFTDPSSSEKEGSSAYLSKAFSCSEHKIHRTKPYSTSVAATDVRINNARGTVRYYIKIALMATPADGGEAHIVGYYKIDPTITLI